MSPHYCDSVCYKNVSYCPFEQSDHQSNWSSCKVTMGRDSIQSSALHACKPCMSTSLVKFNFMYITHADLNNVSESFCLMLVCVLRDMHVLVNKLGKKNLCFIWVVKLCFLIPHLQECKRKTK